MAICHDKSLKTLNDKGYNVVRVPRAGIEPLDLLGRDNGAMEWLGRLETLWQSSTPAPLLLPPQPAVDIEGKRTDSLEIGAGLSLLEGVLKVFNSGAALDAAYNRASELEFAYTNVQSIKAAPLEIGAYLAQGNVDERNPIIQRYFLSDATQGFVLTEVLKSNQLKVTARSSNGETVKVDVDQISATLGANAHVTVSQAGESSLLYSGNTPVTFAFRLLRIAFTEGRWVAQGVKASAETAFDVTEGDAAPEFVSVDLGAAAAEAEDLVAPVLKRQELLELPAPAPKNHTIQNEL